MICEILFRQNCFLQLRSVGSSRGASVPAPLSRSSSASSVSLSRSSSTSSVSSEMSADGMLTEHDLVAMGYPPDEVIRAVRLKRFLYPPTYRPLPLPPHLDRSLEDRWISLPNGPRKCLLSENNKIWLNSSNICEPQDSYDLPNFGRIMQNFVKI